MTHDPHIAVVESVHRSPTHTMRKESRPGIVVLAGLGVEDDAHRGATVKHRSRVARDPSQPNLRQVHLIASELLDELREAGFEIEAGELGENVTTRGIDLLALSAGTRLHLGEEVVVEVTGLRTPCAQIGALKPGLLEATQTRNRSDRVVLKGAVMAIAVTGGVIRPGAAIRVDEPDGVFIPLEPV